MWTEMQKVDLRLVCYDRDSGVFELQKNWLVSCLTEYAIFK